MPSLSACLLLGFLLPWMWGISSWLLQQSAAAAPYLQHGVAPPGLHPWPRTWCSSFPLLLCTIAAACACNLYFKVYFILYEDFYSSFLFLPIWVEYIFPSSHFQYICVLRSEVDFLQTAYMGLVFVSIQWVCVFWFEHFIYLHFK